MANVVKLPPCKPRPLKKTFVSSAPYVIERHDDEDGSIVYEVWDERPDSYRRVCSVSDEYGTNGYAKWDAEQVALGLNLLVQYNKEHLPTIKDDPDLGE